jgi:hypothetical protein
VEVEEIKNMREDENGLEIIEDGCICLAVPGVSERTRKQE